MWQSPRVMHAMPCTSHVTMLTKPHTRELCKDKVGFLSCGVSQAGVPTCSWQMATVVREDSMRLTPAATAEVASPFSRPLCARWPATRDEEQAVSVLTQGPVRPNV